MYRTWKASITSSNIKDSKMHVTQYADFVENTGDLDTFLT